MFNISIWGENMSSKQLFDQLSKEPDSTRQTVIRDCVRFFDTHKIKYCLCGGTACFWYIDDYIYKPAKTHDIDFFIWRNHYDVFKAHQHEFESVGYRINTLNIDYKDYKVQLTNRLLTEMMVVENAGESSISYRKNQQNIIKEKFSFKDIEYKYIGSQRVAIASKGYFLRHPQYSKDF